MTTRSARRAQYREMEAGRAARPRRRRADAASEGPSAIRIAAFAAVALSVLVGGIYMAGSSLLEQRNQSDVPGAILMRVGMDGFDPGTLNARPGETLTIDWWTQDESIHLDGGVHTLVSDSLGVNFALPAKSRQTITLTAPMEAGDYDFWCDSCCGGKENPGMHGTLRVAAPQ